MKRHVCLYTLIFNRRLKNLVTRARLSSCRQVLKLGFMLKVWQKIYWPDHHSKNCYIFYQKYISNAILFQYSAFEVEVPWCQGESGEEQGRAGGSTVGLGDIPPDSQIQNCDPPTFNVKFNSNLFLQLFLFERIFSCKTALLVCCPCSRENDPKKQVKIIHF